MARILVNTRVLNYPLTGVQRVVSEMVARCRGEVVPVAPKLWLSHGMRGHFWEQAILPFKAHGSLLWSPVHSGPIVTERQVVTFHDIVPIDHPEWLNPRFAAWYQYMLPRLASRARHLIAISRFTKERMVERLKVPESKISLVYNGVGEEFYPRSEQEVAAVLDRLGVPSRSYILSLGSLEPRKNLRGLLQAWSRIVREVPEDLWLVIAGGKGRASVFAQTDLTDIPDRVFFSGFVPDNDLPALYAGAEAFTYFSFYEGFGLPPLEAMACGTVPVTSNVASLPEVVGLGGMQVSPFDVDDMAQGILSVIMDSGMRAAMRERGLKRAASFSWDAAAASTLEILRAYS